MTKIHATAIVDPRAQLGEDVEIGPYSIVGPDVSLGARVRRCGEARVLVLRT